MASSQSFSIIQRRMLLSPCPASPVKRELPLWTSAMRLPQWSSLLHLAQHVGQEHHLAVAGAGDEGVVRVAGMLHDEARVHDVGPTAHALQVTLPALAIGRIREHEIEFVSVEGVGGKGGAVLDVVRLAAFSLEDEVGLAVWRRSPG